MCNFIVEFFLDLVVAVAFVVLLVVGKTAGQRSRGIAGIWAGSHKERLRWLIILIAILIGRRALNWWADRQELRRREGRLSGLGVRVTPMRRWDAFPPERAYR